MKSYIIPTVQFEPDAIVIYCCTNDLRRQKQPEENACEIANLASSIKSRKNEIVVSGIVPGKYRFRDKVKEANESLLAICASRNIPFINHGNIDTRTHINSTGRPSCQQQEGLKLWWGRKYCKIYKAPIIYKMKV